VSQAGRPPGAPTAPLQGRCDPQTLTDQQNPFFWQT
jgi:hypothetical protein